MKGEWVQAASGTWHLIWQTSGESNEDGVETSWCHREFKWDDPHKTSEQISGFEDILHDECLRKSEAL